MSDSGASSSSQKPNKGGRPKHSLWQYFKSLGPIGNKTGRYRASCKFCDTSFPDSRSPDFEAHLTDSDKGCKGQTYTKEIREQVTAELLRSAVIGFVSLLHRAAHGQSV